jgi:hypothetical protein
VPSSECQIFCPVFEADVVASLCTGQRAPSQHLLAAVNAAGMFHMSDNYVFRLEVAVVGGAAACFSIHRRKIKKPGLHVSCSSSDSHRSHCRAFRTVVN